MKISQLLSFPLQESVSVSNTPFTIVGKANVRLDDGTKIHWFYDDGDQFMSIIPESEEIILFQKSTEEIEPDDIVLFQGKEFEPTYEDAGNVLLVEGDPLVDEEDRYSFSEYQSKDGDLLRLLTNENTGEVIVYSGKTVSEEDVSEI